MTAILTQPEPIRLTHTSLFRRPSPAIVIGLGLALPAILLLIVFLLLPSQCLVIGSS